MKFNSNETEFKRILEMHSREKKNKIVETIEVDTNYSLYGKKFIIKEQSNTKDELSAMIDKGCVKGGKLQKMKSSAPRDYSIKQEGTTNPGVNFKYFFLDGTVGKKFGTDPFKMDGTWDVSACRDKINQNTPLDKQAKLNDLKKIEGWIEYDELEANGMNKQGADSGKYGEPKIFDLGNGKKVKLYKAPGKEGITKTGYTKEQTETIRRWQAKGYELADDISNDEKQVWERVNIPIPGLDNFVMYLNPGKRVKTSDNDADIETELSNQDYSLKSCKKTLELYYSSFKMKKPLVQSKFTPFKNKTQSCINQWQYKGWGGLRPEHFRDMVKVLRGGNGGPSEGGSDSKWLIN